MILPPELEGSEWERDAPLRYPDEKETPYQDLINEVYEYASGHDCTIPWNGCLNQNRCCKAFFSCAEYFENFEEHTELMETVYSKKVPTSLQMSKEPIFIKRKCDQFKSGIGPGEEGCSIYAERPALCKSFLCVPARFRGRFYKDNFYQKPPPSSGA